MNDKSGKDVKLRRALRDNLKKRKSQSRKLGQGEAFSVKLRSRELIKKTVDEENLDGDKE